MRILVVSNIYPPVVRGGYEVECAGVVQLLRDRGDDVRVLTTRAAADIPFDPLVERTLHYVPPQGTALKLAPLTTVSDRQATKRLLRAFQPDLAFVWNGAHIPHVTIYDILASNVPTAFRVCEHWFGDLFSNDPYMRYLTGGGSSKRRVWSTVIRLVNRLPRLRLEPGIHADVGISWVSRFLRDAVEVPAGLRPLVERVIHPTTQHASRFASVRRQQSNPPVVAFVGRLSREKGADVAIAAVGVLARKGWDIALDLVGGGSPDDLARLRAAAEEAGIAERCAFVGRKEPDGVCDILGRASVLVVPSVWQEPLPITIVEGALARVPIVASRIGGIPEALVEGEEMLLAESGDPDDLARGIETVLADPEEARLRAGRAYLRARELSWQAYSRATTAFIDETVHALRTTRSNRY